MATRGTIAIKRLDGSCSLIYTHYDSYPENNGKILKTFYNTPELVEELISHGDLSVLGTYINPVGEHSFDLPEENCCIYYGRDRGEYNVNPKHYKTSISFFRDRIKEEYDYLYVEDENRWYLLGRKSELYTFMSELDKTEVLRKKNCINRKIKCNKVLDSLF